MVKMIDYDRHSDCPLWEALAGPQIPWTGMRYACLKVLHAYCKVFDKQDLYDLIVRKTCQSCKCPREAHAIYQEQVTSVRERLGFKIVSPTHWDTDPKSLGYTWVPPGIMTSSKVQRYFDKIPQEKVPKIGSSGERYREQQITLQLPKQDLALDYCKHVEPQHSASYEDFVAARNEIALDIGYIKDAPHNTECVHCDERIPKGEMAVIAPKFVDDMMWHPKCFTCNTCDELLVDLTYCVHDDKIYCERHYAEMLRARCNSCDEESDQDRNDAPVDTSAEPSKNVSTDSETDTIASNAPALLSETLNPQLTEDASACSQSVDHNDSPPAGGLRRSPRMDEIDHYEERWTIEERRKSTSISPAPGQLDLIETDFIEDDDGNANDDLISLSTEIPDTPGIEIEMDDTSLDIEDMEIDSDYNEEVAGLRDGLDDSLDTKSESRSKDASPMGDIDAKPPEFLGSSSSDATRSDSESPDMSKDTSAPNPTIAVDYASDQEEILGQSSEEGEEDFEIVETASNPMEGLSDFYDFNASINPSRSRSRSKTPNPLLKKSPTPKRAATKSRSPTRSRSPSQEYKFIHRTPESQVQIHKTAEIIPGLSDFYDFNRMLNDNAYGEVGAPSQSYRSTHRTSVDYIGKDLPIGPVQNSLKLDISNSKNDRLSLEGDGGGTSNAASALEPETPQYPRSFSAEWKHTEKIKDELLTGNFVRSTYVGESMDFSDPFDELREQTKLFKRSNSKSRSPCEDAGDFEMLHANRKQLQDKILDEITKTTLNFQDFSRDMTKDFLEHERRASDSALIQKPAILFQIEDDLLKEDVDEDDIDYLEGEEYHHFRRFSLNQEYQIEEYPLDDEFDYIEQIEVRSLSEGRIWTKEDDFERGDPASGVADDTPEVEEEIDAEDFDDSGSEDERQTVVEVDDEIDEDIWDFNERGEESYNEQSECEQAEREMDRFADKKASDWAAVDGAVGGVEVADNDDDSVQIDQMYDEAIKDRKQSGILRDYDSILQEMNGERSERSYHDDEDDDVRSVRTEDLLEEILKGKENKYVWSGHVKRSSRASSRESTTSFLEYERRENNERRYLADANLDAINSTRLRSRYGIPPASTYVDNNDNLDVDLNYVPKREYKWRKNFKLDEEPEKGTTSSTEMDYLAILEARKFSLGGESVTLYTRSPDRDNDFDPEENSSYEHESLEIAAAQDNESLEKSLKKRPKKKKSQGDSLENGDVSRKNSLNDESELNEDSSKKKSKKKSRKGSKSSLENGDISRRNSLNDENDVNGESSKKKLKKKHRKGLENGELVNDDDSEANEDGSSSPPKEKRKTRKHSKTSLEGSSRRSSLAAENGLSEENSKTEKKKTKKKRKSKGTLDDVTEFVAYANANGTADIKLSPTPEVAEKLPTKSPTPIRAVAQPQPTLSPNPATTPIPTTTARTAPTSFDINDLIKDGGVYPLF